MANESYSVYPYNYDGYASLPLRINGVHEIRAEDVNRLRDAIVKIEQELGIQPSGTYSTVADRLDEIGDAQTFIDAHVADTTDAHDASAVSVADTSDLFYGINVETILEEIGLMLEHRPDSIGADVAWNPNSGIPSFYGGAGTKFVYNVCTTGDWSGEAVDNEVKRTQTRRLSGISGVHIIEVSPSTIDGTAFLTYDQTTTSLRWRAPGDSVGEAVDVSGLSEGETAIISSANTSFKIRIAKNSDSFPVATREEQFEVYSLNAASGLFSTPYEIKESDFITRTSMGDTGVSRNQFMIGGVVYPANTGTIVLQRKRRNDDDFYPIAVLDLGANFNTGLASSGQPVYIPSLSSFDVITLYDRLPALRDYSEYIGADGNQIYENFSYNHSYNTQIAKYLIPVANSTVPGGALGSPDLTTDESAWEDEIKLEVSTYRIVHYKAGITNFNGEPSPSNIHSVYDTYTNSSDGDNTVRFSNLYVDPNPNKPGVEEINVTPPNPILNNDVYVYLSGIRYYGESEEVGTKNYFLFRIQSNDNFLSDTFVQNNALKLTSNVFYIPNGIEDDGYSRYGEIVDLGALLDDAYQSYTYDNVPKSGDKAWYLVSNLYDEVTDTWDDFNYYIDRALRIPANKFSTKARLTATFYDPFGPGDGYDGYGDDDSIIFRSNSFRSNLRTRILVNSYGDRSTDTQEYFTDENYRVGENETFLFPTYEGRFTYADGIVDGNILAEWNSDLPLGQSSLQCGGRWTASETNICGLIFPQNNYMEGNIMPFQFDESITGSGGSGQTEYTITEYVAPGESIDPWIGAEDYDGYGDGQKYYQRLFSLGYPICNARLRVVSGGDNPVSWNDIAYFNTSRFGKIEIKIPGNDGYNDTNWLDIGRLYDGNMEDGYGAAKGAPTGTTGDFTVPFTFGTRNNSNSGNMVAVRVTYFSQNEYATDVLADSKSRIITMLELLPPTTSE